MLYPVLWGYINLSNLSSNPSIKLSPNLVRGLTHNPGHSNCRGELCGLRIPCLGDHVLVPYPNPNVDLSCHKPLLHVLVP